MYFLGIEAFIAIVQTQSISKAANLLHLSQATVSYRLKTLEEEMGGLLVERKKGLKKISLTPMGESFFSIAERLDALRRETQILQTNGPQLALSISVAESLSHFVLPPVYHRLQQYSPPIRLQIRTQHTQEAFHSIESREMDVAFVVREIVSPSVTVKPIFTEDMVLLRLAAPGRQTGDSVDKKDLNPCCEIYINLNKEFQFKHDQWWDPVCPSRIHLDNAGLLPVFMKDMQHWAIVPASVGKQLIQSNPFVLQKLSEKIPGWRCLQVIHKFPNESTMRSIRILDQYLQETFGVFQSWSAF